MKSATTRIVILGGGFAGVYTARYSQRALRPAQRRDVEVGVVAGQQAERAVRSSRADLIDVVVTSDHVEALVRFFRLRERRRGRRL